MTSPSLYSTPLVESPLSDQLEDILLRNNIDSTGKTIISKDEILHEIRESNIRYVKSKRLFSTYIILGKKNPEKSKALLNVVANYLSTEVRDLGKFDIYDGGYLPLLCNRLLIRQNNAIIDVENISYIPVNVAETSVILSFPRMNPFDLIPLI